MPGLPETSRLIPVASNNKPTSRERRTEALEAAKIKANKGARI